MQQLKVRSIKLQEHNPKYNRTPLHDKSKWRNLYERTDRFGEKTIDEHVTVLISYSVFLQETVLVVSNGDFYPC